ncbi:hypothetical protein H4R35_005405 [Dimargaris xerosporica]|nr:hypothetical protein H4R35_005405 [Dimargaris xerosporica]
MRLGLCPWTWLVVTTLCCNLLVCWIVPIAARRTIIDVLAEHAEFRELVRHLQRRQLVIPLNHLTNTTVFAPTNAAFQRHYDQGGHVPTADELRYHLVSRAQWPVALLRHRQLLESLYIPPQGLGGRGGQRLQVTVTNRRGRDAIQVNDVALGNPANLVADNGIVHAIDHLVLPPDRLVPVMQRNAQLAAWRHWLDREAGVLARLTDQTGFTVVAPTTHAFTKGLSTLQQRYFFHPVAVSDLSLLLQTYVIPQIVYHQDVAEHPTNAAWTVQSLAGIPWQLQVDSSGILWANNSRLTLPDQLAENGVIHLTDQLALPTALTFDARKYLIAVNATRFVDLLQAHGFTGYLGALPDTTPLTLLAPVNDAFDNYFEELPEPGTMQMTQYLAYHILPNHQHTLVNLADGQLVPTALWLDSLGGGYQRVKVTRGSSVRSQSGAASTPPDMAFNHATVVSEPITIGRLTIYRLASPLSPPEDLLHTVVANLRFSTFLATLYHSRMQHELQAAKNVTYFVPSNQALARLDVTLSYLMSPEGTLKLQQLQRMWVARPATYVYPLKSHYPDLDRPDGGACLETLEGMPLSMVPYGTETRVYFGACFDDRDSNVNARPNRDSYFSKPGDAGSMLLDAPYVPLVQTDTLVSNGVVQYMDQVVLPPLLNITLYDLVRTLKAHTFLAWLAKFNMTDLLHHPVSDAESGRYTVLVPSDRALAQLNLGSIPPSSHALWSSNSATKDDDDDHGWSDVTRNTIKRILALHFIPNRRVTRWQDRETYMTLLPGVRLVTREYDTERFMVRIQSASLLSKRQWTTVVRHGQAANGMVYQLDGVLAPAVGWFDAPNWETLRNAVWWAILGFMTFTFVGVVAWPVWQWYESCRTFREGYEPI